MRSCIIFAFCYICWNAGIILLALWFTINYREWKQPKTNFSKTSSQSKILEWKKDILIVRAINSIRTRLWHAMMGFMVIVLKLGFYVQKLKTRMIRTGWTNLLSFVVLSKYKLDHKPFENKIVLWLYLVAI